MTLSLSTRLLAVSEFSRMKSCRDLPIGIVFLRNGRQGLLKCSDKEVMVKTLKSLKAGGVNPDAALRENAKKHLLPNSAS